MESTEECVAALEQDGVAAAQLPFAEGGTDAREAMPRGCLRARARVGTKDAYIPRSAALAARGVFVGEQSRTHDGGAGAFEECAAA